MLGMTNDVVILNAVKDLIFCGTKSPVSFAKIFTTYGRISRIKGLGHLLIFGLIVVM